MATLKVTADKLRELVRRLPSTPYGLLEKIVTDGRLESDVRSMAALELGVVPVARSSMAALTQGAHSADGAVARRCIEVLGRLGDAAAIETLRELRQVPAAARRSLEFALVLLRFRHGIGTRSRKASVAPTPLSDGQRTLRVERLSGDARSEMLAALPGVASSGAGSAALRFDCGPHRWSVVSNPLLGSGALAALRSPMVLAVVFKQSPVMRSWYIAEYIFSQPSSAGDIELTGYRPSGTLIHVGRVVLADGGARVELGAVDTPLMPPTDVSAGLDAKGRVELQIRVDPTRRNALSKPRSPTAARPQVSSAMS